MIEMEEVAAAKEKELPANLAQSGLGAENEPRGSAAVAVAKPKMVEINLFASGLVTLVRIIAEIHRYLSDLCFHFYQLSNSNLYEIVRISAQTMSHFPVNVNW